MMWLTKVATSRRGCFGPMVAGAALVLLMGAANAGAQKKAPTAPVKAATPPAHATPAAHPATPTRAAGVSQTGAGRPGTREPVTRQPGSPGTAGGNGYQQRQVGAPPSGGGYPQRQPIGQRGPVPNQAGAGGYGAQGGRETGQPGHSFGANQPGAGRETGQPGHGFGTNQPGSGRGPGQPGNGMGAGRAPVNPLYRGSGGPTNSRVVNTMGGPVREMRGPGGMATERGITGRPGFYRHTDFPRGGHPSAYVYREYHYGPYHYFRPVPPVVYNPAFYTMSFGAPVTFAWGWGGQPWYTAYGSTFTPYQNYPSMDYWMTDYVISQNLQQAYAAAPPSGGGAAGAMAPEPNGSAGPDPNAAAGPPPPIPDEVKQQIETEIKTELQEQQALAARGANNVAPPADPNEPDQMPDALKPSHTMFLLTSEITAQVNGASCTLGPGDVIVRTSGMLQDGSVSVRITTSRSTECAKDATTQISLSDLNDMVNQQEQQIASGLKYVAANVGKNGLPNGVTPGATLVAAGQTNPDMTPPPQ